MSDTFPRIPHPETKIGVIQDAETFRIEFPLEDHLRDLVLAKLEQIDENLVVEWLRGRGFTVGKIDGPKGVRCPNCQARPGQPCSTPTDTGRRDVRSDWFHYARRDAVNA